MEPYQTDRLRECGCGCGTLVSGLVKGRPRRFVNGHNMRGVAELFDQRQKIGHAQRRAWQGGRQRRVEIGSVRIKNGIQQIRVQSPNGWAYWKAETRPLDKYRSMSAEQLSALPPHTRTKLRRKHGYTIPAKPRGVPKGYRQSSEHVAKRRTSQRKYLFDLRSVDRDARERIRKTPEYKTWRTVVFKRDDWTCQGCGARSGNGRGVKLEAHHLKSFTKYPKLRFEVTNGITLCKPCHGEETGKAMRGTRG
jgi:5-methylcytosine-specific restriction endonuclease McrA